jgi:hypothetical protein
MNRALGFNLEKKDFPGRDLSADAQPKESPCFRAQKD